MVLWIVICGLSLICAVWAFCRLSVSRRQKSLDEYLRTLLPQGGLSAYVSCEYSNQYIDAVRCDALHTLFSESYANVCAVYDKSRLLLIKNAFLEDFKVDFEELDSIVDEHNSCFKEDKLRECKDFFDKVLAYPLDVQQRRSIVSEERNCLVVSSAGSGKTSSIVGKVEYLIQEQHVDPHRILLISYTRKAAAELTARMSHPGLQGYTFHKLALDIIARSTNSKPSVCDNTDALFVSIFRELSENKDYRKCLAEYFRDYSDWLELDADEQMKNVRRLQLGDAAEKPYKSLFPDMDGMDVSVRSSQERKICFMLTSLGVKYRYEEPYEHPVADEHHSQYRPDFSIHYECDGRPCRLYLEHFGVDEHGMVPMWFADDHGLTYEEANKRYNDGITWKREVHQKYGTRLIALSSADFKYHKERQKLKSLLLDAGAPINEIHDEELLDMIMPPGSMQEKALIRLTATFTTLLKSSGKAVSELQMELQIRGSERDKFIVDRIMLPVVNRYNQMLKRRGQKDFSDLIIDATSLCNVSGGGGYDYIIVDEFQDISMDRCLFLQALRKGNPPAQLYCVGDDWQSIYRFSGSDMNLFNHFDRYFGKTDVNKIETTYRFGNPLVKESSSFIQRNPAQIRKNIRPFSLKIRTELTFREYGRQNYVAEIESVVAGVPADKTVFLLGRYSFDDYMLEKSFRQRRAGSAVYYTIGGREIEFMTIHKSKGLEADYVVLLNCNNGSFGFPSTIVDDLVLGYVMSDREEYLFGEERRLFYVAITRAKEKTVVMYDKNKPSVFVIEYLHPERLSDKPLSPHRNANKRWTVAEEKMLRQLYVQGVGIRLISQKMGRSQTSIIMRLEKLGLVDCRKPIRKK